MGSCTLSSPLPRLDPFRMPAATEENNNNKSAIPPPMKELLLVSLLPSSPSLSAVPHKKLTLPPTVPNLPSPSRVAQSLLSQLKCSVEGWAFSRLNIVPFPACLSLSPMGAISTSLPDSQNTCYIASDKNLSAEASYFLSGNYWPHLTPFSTFWKWDERMEKADVSFPVLHATPLLPL